ncbi:hypothetical protein G5B35_06740 [Parapusillimonas sp. SGNA-6]|nr:hypothetical protein [Parapusillimonas sp. SGNA-6]
MGKIIFWAFIIIGGLFLARILARHNARRDDDESIPPQAPRRGAPPVGHAEAMVQCEHCGIHMPRSEAVLSQGRIWCSVEHARLGTKE